MNSVDNTKLPCYTLPPMQHHSFSGNLPPLSIWRTLGLLRFRFLPIFRAQMKDVSLYHFNSPYRWLFQTPNWPNTFKSMIRAYFTPGDLVHGLFRSPNDPLNFLLSLILNQKVCYLSKWFAFSYLRKFPSFFWKQSRVKLQLFCE